MDYNKLLKKRHSSEILNVNNEIAKGGRQINYCKTCLMPNSRPRIVFNKEGICNACVNAQNKPLIDWEAREKEFFNIIDKFTSKGALYDCIVPWSGGKDSSTIAHKLKYKFGLNPLLVTCSPMLSTEVGDHNREELIKQGFDHYFFRPNQKIHRILARRFFIERGNPKVAWDAGVNTIPVQAAVKFKIPLIFYAEHGESEYGGKVLKENSNMISDFTEVLEHQIGDDPRNWITDEISEKDLAPYLYPSIEDVEKINVKALYFAYFFKWSMFENYNYIKEKYDFRTHPKGRTIGTFTNFDSLDDKFDNLYYYMQYIKFGFGRCIRDASRFIQNKHMTYEEGLNYAKKYDGEFPVEYLDDVLEYLDLTYDEFIQVVDKHRNNEIWKFENGKWKLRFPLQ